ncbi:MAG: thioredoxin [Gammaproteobacteria bacterium]|nr:thioredoxin [Gammaproteobacteria bacterium]
MATIELTNDNFEETIKNNDIVLIDFWATWCGPCKMFGPIFEEASNAHENVVFAKVDTEAQQELAAQFQIRSIPTLMAIKEQVIVFSQPGALPASALNEIVGKVIELDMQEVRKEIEDQDSSS